MKRRRASGSACKSRRRWLFSHASADHQRKQRQVHTALISLFSCLLLLLRMAALIPAFVRSHHRVIKCSVSAIKKWRPNNFVCAKSRNETENSSVHLSINDVTRSFGMIYDGQSRWIKCDPVARSPMAWPSQRPSLSLSRSAFLSCAHLLLECCAAYHRNDLYQSTVFPNRLNFCSPHESTVTHLF